MRNELLNWLESNEGAEAREQCAELIHETGRYEHCNFGTFVAEYLAQQGPHSVEGFRLWVGETAYWAMRNELLNWLESNEEA